MSRLFIGNISPKIDIEKLENIFSEYGKLSGVEVESGTGYVVSYIYIYNIYIIYNIYRRMKTTKTQR